MSLAILIIPLMRTFPAMIGAYLFLGLGEAVLWPVLGAFAVEEGRAYFGHGTMMGVFNLAMSAGVFTGALVAGIGLDALGMQAAFVITSASIMLLTLYAVLLIRSETDDTAPATLDGDQKAAGK
jgi:predicted MFS family arabinose efflux permease